MHRTAIKYDLEEFKKEREQSFLGSKLISVSLYIDEKEKKKILDFLDKNKTKFQRILVEILSGSYRFKLYDREEVSDRAKGITAMKFSSGSFLNARLYCKEFFMPDGKKVVIISLLEKKKVRNAKDKVIKNLLETIGGYEYDFKEE